MTKLTFSPRARPSSMRNTGTIELLPHPWKREFKLPWREVGPLNHLSHGEVDPDQLVVNKELSLCRIPTVGPFEV